MKNGCFEISNIGFNKNLVIRKSPKRIHNLYGELIHANFTDLLNCLTQAEEAARQDFSGDDQDKRRRDFLKILSTARMITECQEFTFSELEKIMEGKIDYE